MTPSPDHQLTALREEIRRAGIVLVFAANGQAGD
jgi:hypothetical protein